MFGHSPLLLSGLPVEEPVKELSWTWLTELEPLLARVDDEDDEDYDDEDDEDYDDEDDEDYDDEDDYDDDYDDEDDE
ncbi:MAG: hypothetical protein N2112_06720 [Gemmataceae bacterium]|nr:hypothetical protein [Gemmataceae bacterium]